MAATVNSVVIEHNIDNVEVIGYKVFPKSIEFLDHRIAVRNEQPVLKSILDKAVAMVNREEIQTLSSKWIDFYNINMEGTLELNQEEKLVGELAKLQTIMMILEDREEFEKAAIIQKKIRNINKKLNNASGKY